MNLQSQTALVTGGASGLGLATVRKLITAGATVVIADLPNSDGLGLAEALGASFVPTDVTDKEQVAAAVAHANQHNDLRAVVHTAGRGGPVRLVGKDGQPGDSDTFTRIVTTNLIGSYLVASHAAAAMAGNTDQDGERGAIVLTSSIAAYEGQVGQVGYAASKAGVVGLTLVAARDVAPRGVRVCTIAPGLMDTPMLGGLREDIREALASSVPNPSRLGSPDEFSDLALHIISNKYLNGETIRLDGALRMAPR